MNLNKFYKLSLLKSLRDIMIILFITLGLIEIGFRLIPKSLIPNLGPNKININFKSYGPWFAPNQKVTFADNCSFVYPISINNFGMRDKERKIIKTKKLRIAILGDSIMEGLHVKDYNYASILIENKLVANGFDAEVLNFSFSGYGTAQQLSLYKNFVYKFKPDIILLFSLASNDLRNNSRELEYIAYGSKLEDYGSSKAPPFSYYEYENNKLIYYPNLRKQSEFKKIIKKYILYNFFSLDYIRKVIIKFQRIRLLSKIERTNSNVNITKKINKQKNENNILSLKKKSIINTHHIIKELKKSIKDQNGKMLQVIYNDNNDNSKIFEEIAKKNLISFINFGPNDNDIYKKYLEKNKININKTHPICDSHPNALGHFIIADITTKWLTEQIKELF
jgi:hypothetical protein